ncbi:peptidoglycan D,D-transpeptidase FtsI family protein [Parvibium lacunae]|uniref:Peptidoglycan D,D-transpeptidase FtsI n=1 Tax=Parvibium lacunae TaxID=1888893 RepID=A0A368L281_9BURK|nr:penicillin-binding protein 2 [Parvibium lacunae]RCS57561.1 penicillin-binding protein 2 [Parvibium lacunae]
MSELGLQHGGVKVGAKAGATGTKRGSGANKRGVSFSANPVLNLSLPRWRSRLLLVLIALAFLALIARAVYLQGFSTDFLQRQGESRYARTLELPATRGKILDRNGVVLASSVPAKAIWAIPDDVMEISKNEKISLAQREQEWRERLAKLPQLASLLNLPLTELKRKLQADRSFVYLRRQVDLDVAEKIAALKIAGIHERDEYKRYYPEGETLAHVVGFTNIEDLGQEGVELSMQQALVGVNGSRRVIKDRLGRVIEDMGSTQPPRDGRDLTLSIDTRIQYVVYSQLKQAMQQHRAKAAAAVVLDVQTGEVLALANFPTYNPNQRSHLSGAELRNRVLTDAFEPGSTLKPFTVALGLEQRLITPQKQIQTAPGKLTIGTATIGDAHPHGWLTVEEIVQKSSNVGTAKIALQIEREVMWSFLTELGFGQAPRVGFPGATAGRVRPWKSWRPIEQATMSYGHGISVSLIQLARAYSIFARDGDLVPLSFQKLNAGGQPLVTQRVVSAKTAQSVRKMLEMAAGPGGTAPKAQVIGYSVAGKTGTAHKLGKQGYENRYVSSFAGFAPVGQPRIIIAVMVDEPSAGKHYGGEVAAPIYSAIVENAMRILQIQPDIPHKTEIVVPAEVLEEGV